MKRFILFLSVFLALSPPAWGTTKNIVPNATGEGSIGTSAKHWLAGYFDNIYIGSTNTTLGAAGSDKQIQFNDGGMALAGAAAFTWNKATLTALIGTGAFTLPYSYGAGGITSKNLYGSRAFEGYSKSSYGANHAMGAMGLMGVGITDSASYSYGLYTEGWASFATGDATQSAEIAIINTINNAVDIKPTTNMSTLGSAYSMGMWISSGRTDVTSYPASVALGITPVGSTFRRGIVIMNGALTDLVPSTDYRIGMEMPDNTRVCWGDDNHCINYSAAYGFKVLNAGTSYATINSSGLVLPNNAALWWFDTGATARGLAYLDTTNNFILGGNTGTASSITSVRAGGTTGSVYIQSYNGLANWMAINASGGIQTPLTLTFTGSSSGVVLANNTSAIWSYNASTVAKSLMYLNSANNLIIGGDMGTSAGITAIKAAGTSGTIHFQDSAGNDWAVWHTTGTTGSVTNYPGWVGGGTKYVCVNNNGDMIVSSLWCQGL